MADIKKNANRVRGKLKVSPLLIFILKMNPNNLSSHPRILNKVSRQRSKESQQVLIYEYVRHSTRLYHESLSRL